ncbi:MAG: tetraacyldisaccharide 4'-kinase, partial [Gammaproteobacteria bacterium]|nr:tetraacyldisaccharide 4'-kinase [Gammaproteobacteria bacterium]
MRWHDQLWYRAPRYCAWPLLPLSLLYRIALFFRNYFYRFKTPRQLSVAVVVVGNLTVGGTGKT